jgi:hypothetical protein
MGKKDSIEAHMQDIIDQETSKLDNPKKENKTLMAARKILILTVSVFMLLLILSYFVPGYSLFRVIAAQFNSFEADGNFIELKDGYGIMFEGNSFNDLQHIYFDNQQHEFKACLIGVKENKDFIIKNVKIPEIISQDFSSVTAKPCGEGTIISLHSHPYKSCYFSLHDISNYRYVSIVNEEAFIGIMCEAKRFNFYGYS